MHSNQCLTPEFAVPSAIPANTRLTGGKNLSRFCFLTAVGVQVACVALLFGAKYQALANNQTITVPCNLYDPFDPLRGNYLSLSFGRLSEVQTARTFDNGAQVFVRLDTDKDGWYAKEVSLSKLKPTGKQLIAKATVRGPINIWSNGRPTNVPSSSERLVQLDYGSERFYVPYGKGGNISSSQTLQAKLSIADDGSLSMKQLGIGQKDILSCL